MKNTPLAHLAFLILIAWSGGGALSMPAVEYFVSGSGNDTADGLDVSRAFRSLDRASRLVNPGDTIWVMNGTYTGSSTNGNVVDLTRSGTPTAWITLKAYPGHHPELIVNGWGGVNILANYQIVDGLLITGNNDNVTLAQAEADAAKPDCSPAFTNGGVNSDGRGVTDKFHHMIVRNCIIRKCGGGALGGGQIDYITLEDNQIYDSCWYNRFGCSAISLYQLVNVDQAPGYHNIIRRNRIWNNRNLVKWYVNNEFMDGNGIIIDDSKNTQNGSTNGPYTGRTLIYDNVCFNNGGSGIHVYSSEHVDIVNNTTFNNGTKVHYPEIDANDSNDVKILNNIMFAATNGDVNNNYASTNVLFDYNVYWNGKVVVTGPHDVIADPRLMAPSLDPLTADFHLQSGSPAADNAMIFDGVTNVPDIGGLVRPQGAGTDRGAYERLVIIAPVGSGTGLLGSYFTSRDLTGPALTRIDRDVRFDWGTGSPLTGIGADNFSVRWTGQVQAQFTESYTFSTVSDDGIRLWVDGRLLIDNWTDHAPMENRGSITLNAGQKYELKLEYFENSGGAVAQLWWESASTAKQSVPTSQLYPAQLPINGLPVGWSALDIGVVGAVGSSTQANGQWTVIGSGDDIWNTADGFQFVSRPVTGDVMITARVTGLTNTDAWAKAGVMVRESLVPEARHASTFATAGNGLTFQRRLTPGGASSHTAGPGKAAPQWVRIERIANTLISSTSTDGAVWTEIRRQTIAMTPTVYVGLAVTSHRRGTLCTATFSDVQVVAASLTNN